MKLVHISVHFEFTQEVERILDDRDVQNYVRTSMVQGRDSCGKHQGTQVHPGNLSFIQAQVADDAVEGLLEDLREFQQQRKTHHHITAVVLGVEKSLAPGES